MLTDVLKKMINNSFKENFVEKEKKKQLMFWPFFFISHKNGIKIFLKLIVNYYSKDTR